jgi:hypothetical protein
LEDSQRKGFYGGEDGAERGSHIFAESLQVWELTLKPLGEDATEALWELFRAVERKVALLHVLAKAFDIEEHAFALI